MKSLRSSGSEHAARAARRSSSEPPKLGPSVRIESGDRAAALIGGDDRSELRRSCRAPADGERRLNSAITPMPGARERIAQAPGARAGGPAAALAARLLERMLALAPLELLARFGDDPLQHAWRLRRSPRVLGRRVAPARRDVALERVARRCPSASAARAAWTPSAIVSARPAA